MTTPAVVWPSEEKGTRPHAIAERRFEVGTLDSLSLSGLSLCSAEPYQAGQELWIRFRIGSKICQMKGVVCHGSVRRSGERLPFLCGLEFVRCHQTLHAQEILAGYLSPLHFEPAA